MYFLSSGVKGLTHVPEKTLGSSVCNILLLSDDMNPRLPISIVRSWRSSS